MLIPTDLRQAMAEHGFESHEDYGYALRCLVEQAGRRLRCLAIEGDCGRRKTAFATALADALAVPHRLYLDLAHLPPAAVPAPVVEVDEDEPVTSAPPLPPLDRVLSDACAFSEAESTLCILDQLQVLDFSEQIRLHRFLQTGTWQTADGEYVASPRRLLLFLISEAPLYHSLQKQSFRLWVKRAGYAEYRYRAEEFGLPVAAQSLIDALEPVFAQLAVLPTHSEYGHLLDDIHARVGSAEELAQSIYGWTEGVSPGQLAAPECRERLAAAMAAIDGYLGADVVELSSPASPSH